MKKQIIYADLIPRLFASSLDLSLIVLIAFPVTTFISWKLSLYFFKVNITEVTLNMLRDSELTRHVDLRNFFEYFDLRDFLLYNLCLLIMTFLIYGAYFVGFWTYCSATPGKMIMRMKIVDAETLEKPTQWQFVKRFLGYITIPLGIWFVPFSKQHRALHDILSGTAVIKN